MNGCSQIEDVSCATNRSTNATANTSAPTTEYSMTALIANDEETDSPLGVGRYPNLRTSVSVPCLLIDVPRNGASEDTLRKQPRREI